MTKYIVIEVLEREIGIPRIYDTLKSAKQDMCDSFAQVKGYHCWDDFVKDYPEAEVGDYIDDNFGIYSKMAYAETANHDDWDIRIFNSYIREE